MSIYREVYLWFINIPVLLGFIIPPLGGIILAFMRNYPLSGIYWAVATLLGVITLGMIVEILKLKHLTHLTLTANIGLGLIIILVISFVIERVTLIRILY